jgi:hypothetical protein
MMPYCGGAIAGNSWTNPCSRNSSSPNRSTTSIAPATGNAQRSSHFDGQPVRGFTGVVSQSRRLMFRQGNGLTSRTGTKPATMPCQTTPSVSRMNEVRAGNGPCGATRNGMIHHMMGPIGAATANQMARILARLYWPPNSASRAIATESAASSRCPTAGCRAHASTSDSAGEEERRTLLPPPRRRRDRTRWASRSTPAIEYPIPI